MLLICFRLSSGTAKQADTYNVKVVDSLKSNLMTATKDFKTVLEVRSNKMKDQQERKKELTGLKSHSILILKYDEQIYLKVTQRNQSFP
jgi:hypothetical protein